VADGPLQYHTGVQQRNHLFSHAPTHGGGARARAEDCCHHCGRYLSWLLVCIFRSHPRRAFSRRWYATVLAALSGTAAAVAVLSLHHLLVLQTALVIGSAAAGLSSSALGGWLSNLAPNEHKNPLSKWMNIAIFSGTGLISAAGGEFVRRLPVIPAAILTGTIVFLPAAVFLFIPAPGADRRLASESFVQFNREVLSWLRRREVVLVLLLFLSPCSTFVLPYLFGGLVADFHASARPVSLAGGAGAFIPGLLGCSLFPVIARRMRLRSLSCVAR
jgi:PAT family beta-lactamase induction signal transducer AmpG